MKYPIRINRYLRDKGIASRREADLLVDEGKVLVNGKPVDKGHMVLEGDDVVVEGERKRYRYLAYYKPRGLPTQDLPGQRSVITDWREKGLYPVGRLDKESEGLLILTNDGRLTPKMLSNKEEYEKEYIVTVREVLNPEMVDILESGMKIGKFGRLLPVKAEMIDDQTMRIVLREGKKKQIRVMFNELAYTVTSLKRIRIGKIELEDLMPGESRPIDIKI